MELAEQLATNIIGASPDALARAMENMDLSVSGLNETADSLDDKSARDIKSAARGIAWNIILKSQSTCREAAEHAALATILLLRRAQQTLTIRTLVGPKEIPAPANFEFDKTATAAWTKLVQITRETAAPTKLQRDRYVLEGKIEILALILSNSLGFTSHYWIKTARDFASRGTP